MTESCDSCAFEAFANVIPKFKLINPDFEAHLISLAEIGMKMSSKMMRIPAS